MTPASVGVARGILRNAAALFLVGLFAKGAGLVIAVLVARFLGADAMGLFALLFAIEVLVETFISMGMSESFVRDVAAKPRAAAGMYVAALKLVACISLAPAAALAVAAFLVSDADTTRACLLIIAFGTPISGGFVVAQAVLQGSERVLLLTWVTLAARVVSIAALLVAFYNGAGLEAAFGSRVLFQLLAFAVFTAVILKSLQPTDDAHSPRMLLARSVPFAINRALAEAGLRLPSLVLPSVVGLAGAGLFDAANRIRGTLGMTMSASITGLMPAFARNARDSGVQSGALIGHSVKYICIGMSLAATAITLLSTWIVGLLYGPAFAAAARPLELLAWAQVLVAVHAVLQQAMLAAGAVVPAIRNSAIGVTMQLILLFVLSTTMGLVGAGLAVLLSSAVLVAVDLRYVHRHVTPLPIRKAAAVPLATATLVAGMMLAIDGGSFAYRLAAAAGAWGIAVALFRLLPREELRFMLRLAKPGGGADRDHGTSHEESRHA